jgi:transposase
MTGVEQLPTDPQALMEIILRQQAELNQREAALELCDLHMEKIRQEATAAVAERDAALFGRHKQIEAMKREAAAAAAALAQRDSQIEQIKREAAEQIEILQKKHQAEIRDLLERIYGSRKGQPFDPAQLLIFGQLIDTMPLDEAAIQKQAGEPLITRRPRGRDNHGRAPLPAHLERVPIQYTLEGDQLKCPCCGKLRKCIGKEVTEQLERFQSFKVLQHVQHKYACEDCEKQGLNPRIELAPKPPQPIEKGLAGPGLLAYVITSKLADHLPFYRLNQIFGRHDVHVADSTMCGWIMACAKLVAPLALLMKQRIKQGKVIWCDETGVPIKCRDGKPVKDKCHKGRIWVYIGDDGHPYIVYEYTPDKGNAWPLSWLEGYEGYLQVDAGTSFDIVFRSYKVIEVGCWAHGRRKIDEARETDARRADEMLKMIRQLYDVEDKAKDLSNDARRDLRQELSVPILNTIKAWLDREIQLVLPRSPMAGAMNYLLNQWAALLVYTTDGALKIDNNVSERRLKLIAIGRRNWLFFGNEEFAKYYAGLYSLIASAQLHGVDPQAYLTHVLTHIATTPTSELEQLLPDACKAHLEAKKAAGHTSPPAFPASSPAIASVPGP